MLGSYCWRGRSKDESGKSGIVKEWREPTKKKEVQLFLGFCNFYRHFIRGFAGVAKPLTLLTGKGEWVWGEEQHEVFEELKEVGAGLAQYSAGEYQIV